jgi:hypothetical protein
MKVEVLLKMKTSPEADSKFDLTVRPSDTVESVKERLAGLQMIPFPDQELVLNGQVLSNTSKLAQCGVQDGTTLDFVIKASETTFVEQLTELLQARDLSADELGLLYCYKHGVAANQALKMLGIDGKLPEFLKSNKKFHVDSGRVTVMREDTSLKPFSVNDEVVRLLKANAGTMEIKELCGKFAQKFSVSMASIVGMRPTEYFAKETEFFVVAGRGIVALKSMVAEEASRSVREPVPEKATQFVGAPPGLSGNVDDNQGESWTPDNEQYLELHNRISSRAFNSKVVQFLGDMVELISQNIFLTVDHHVKGGSVGRGTAITGCTDAEVVFFLQGLPPSQHDKWLPPLLKSVAGILKEHLGSRANFESIQAAEDCVQLFMQGVRVDLRFSPTFESFPMVIETLAEQDPEVRKFYASAFAKERVQFISRQPPQVKMTIRLLKWWRDQQEWSSKLTYPKDEVLELMAVYSAVQTKPKDQRMAVANVMSLFSRFSEMRIVWSNYYGKDDVWAPLLRQRPLLMDPTNPFVNVSDPQSFDAMELMHLARTTHFFW